MALRCQAQEAASTSREDILFRLVRQEGVVGGEFDERVVLRRTEQNGGAGQVEAADDRAVVAGFRATEYHPAPGFRFFLGERARFVYLGGVDDERLDIPWLQCFRQAVGRRGFIIPGAFHDGHLVMQAEETEGVLPVEAEEERARRGAGEGAALLDRLIAERRFGFLVARAARARSPAICRPDRWPPAAR